MASLSPNHWRPRPVTGVRVMPRPLPPAELHAMLPLTPSAPLPRLPIALCWLCSAMSLVELREVYRVMSASTLELCQTARCHMRGRTAGAVELYHALCLFEGGEPLRAPLASVVGGLVADFDSHGVGFVWWYRRTERAGSQPPPYT